MKVLVGLKLGLETMKVLSLSLHWQKKITKRYIKSAMCQKFPAFLVATAPMLGVIGHWQSCI